MTCLGGSTEALTQRRAWPGSALLKNIQELFLRQNRFDRRSQRTKANPRDRLKDIISFYEDLDKCIGNGAYYLKKDGFCFGDCFKESCMIPSYILISLLLKLGRSYGLRLKNIYYRDIHNKRMPRKVSATNVVGEKTDTMTEESLLFCKNYSAIPFGTHPISP